MIVVSLQMGFMLGGVVHFLMGPEQIVDRDEVLPSSAEMSGVGLISSEHLARSAPSQARYAGAACCVQRSRRCAVGHRPRRVRRRSGPLQPTIPVIPLFLSRCAPRSPTTKCPYAVNRGNNMTHISITLIVAMHFAQGPVRTLLIGMRVPRL